MVSESLAAGQPAEEHPLAAAYNVNHNSMILRGKMCEKCHILKVILSKFCAGSGLSAGAIVAIIMSACLLIAGALAGAWFIR